MHMHLNSLSISKTMALCNSKSSTHFRIQQSQPLLFLNFLKLTIIVFVPFPFANSISFKYLNFQPNDPSIYYQGDAFAANEAIELTSAQDMNAHTRIGRASYSYPVHLWDSKTGNLTDFYTIFTFIMITPTNNVYLGDGLTFFLSPYNASIPINPLGGLLGLFNSTDLSHTQIVAIEFDTKQDSWDPCPYHMGIDVNSIASLIYSQLDDRLASGTAAAAVVSYNSTTQTLMVLLSYDEFQTYRYAWHVIDLRNVLPEWVSVGFSASLAAGSTERHTITSWIFNSSYSILEDSSNSTLGASASPSNSTSGSLLANSALAALHSNSTLGGSPSNSTSGGSTFNSTLGGSTSTNTAHKTNLHLVVYLPVGIGSLIFGVCLFLFIMNKMKKKEDLPIPEAGDQDQTPPQTSQRPPQGSSHGINANAGGGATGNTNTGGNASVQGSGNNFGCTTIQNIYNGHPLVPKETGIPEESEA